MKKENTKVIIWAAVALIVGVVIGLLITNLGAIGKATNVLEEKPIVDDLIVTNNELYTYAIKNNIPLVVVSSGEPGDCEENTKKDLPGTNFCSCNSQSLGNYTGCDCVNACRVTVNGESVGHIPCTVHYTEPGTEINPTIK